MKLLTVVIALALVSASLAKTAEEWRARSIYQILTDRYARTDNSRTPCADIHNYCGGTFKGIQNNLDYILSMGFDAIWISPVVKNLDGGYHGYWATDINSINEHFGSDQDLKDLVNACHAKGIWVMVDVVANHVGPVGMDFSQIKPFNDPSHYHARCQINNWSNQTEVEYCRLADLPDLDQNNQYVHDTLLDWIRNLVPTYQFDGIRIDTIPEVHPQFWAEFTKASGVYQVGEILNQDYGYIGNYQNYMDGVLNYPLYYQLKNVFGSRQSMYTWRNHYSNMDKFFKNQDLLGNFVDNHDNARYLYYYKDVRGFKAALAFALTSRGIPMTYYGSEQGYAGGNDPENRETLWTSGFAQNDLTNFLKLINQARKDSQWYNQPQIERYVDDSFYAFTRGLAFCAFTNQYDQQQVRTISYHPYSEGQTLCNIFYPTDCVKVQGGSFSVYLNNGEVKIFLPKTSTTEFLEIMSI